MHLETWIQRSSMSEFPLDKMNEIFSGISQLHSLDFVHRDIKPSNILVDSKGVMRVSDMGISKQLNGRTSYTGGTLGWQAPEQMKQERQSVKTDIFSLGCLLDYCISQGNHHPFGLPILRDANIYNSNPCLTTISNPLAVNLTRRMVSPNPADRPSIDKCSSHPLFWDAGKKIRYLCKASDRFMSAANAPSLDDTRILKSLQAHKREIFPGRDWMTLLPNSLQNELTGNRGKAYKSYLVSNLLRAIRNTTNHYREMQIAVQNDLGVFPNEFCNYWETTFPQLLIITYETIEQNFAQEQDFLTFF